MCVYPKNLNKIIIIIIIKALKTLSLSAAFKVSDQNKHSAGPTAAYTADSCTINTN